MAVTAANSELIDPESYFQNGYPWKTWARLRRDSPIHPLETKTGELVWAATRYEDIISIERNAEVFKSAPRMTMSSEKAVTPTRMIVNMDPPDHATYRGIVSSRFMPRSISGVRDFVAQTVNKALDDAMALNGEVFDLQKVIANPVPTAVISRILGVSNELAPLIHAWTEATLYPSDPEIGLGRPITEVRSEATQSMFKVYAALFDERRANPTDDLLSDLLNARINGEPLPDLELYSWCYILTLAGHETTQSTFGAAIHTLMEHPDQFQMLRERPELLGGAIEELLRFISPAIHFCRTPDRDVDIHGKTVRAGQPIVLFYPSGNRDESAFSRPDEFNITRTNNRHLAFGSGPHVCLGMHLARLELGIMLRQFLDRVDHVEAAGAPTPVHSCSVGGFRKYPVRMQVRAR